MFATVGKYKTAASMESDNHVWQDTDFSVGDANVDQVGLLRGTKVVRDHMDSNDQASLIVYGTVFEEIDFEEIDLDNHLNDHRELHGCHRKECNRKCPVCTFPFPTAIVGHCKQNGRLFNCRRRIPGT